MDERQDDLDTTDGFSVLMVTNEMNDAMNKDETSTRRQNEGEREYMNIMVVRARRKSDASQEERERADAVN